MRAGLARLAEMPDWLAVLDDPARLEAALRQAVPGVRGAKLSGVRLRPGASAWTARCRLRLAGDDGQERELHLAATIVPPGQAPPAVGVDDGWNWVPALRLALAPEDQAEAKLPALAMLTDPPRARDWLEQAIRAGAPAYRDLRILACEPRVTRYTPGSRCTILYRLELPEGRPPSWPDVVVAKTYHRPDKGRIAWEGMRALWDSPLGHSAVVAIAEPLAWSAGERILVQGPIRQERTLKDLLLTTLAGGPEGGDGDLRAALAKAAAGLAELHRCGAPSARRATFAGELAEVREVLGRLTARLPELRGAGEPFLDEVERLAERVPADAPVPTHRSFRPAQVLLHQGEIGFIDFDGFCHAEPALDLALFRATLRDLGMSALPAGADPAALDARMGRLDELGEVFLAGYEALAPVSRRRVAAWEALDLFTNVLHSWTKATPVRLGRALALVDHHAASLAGR